MAETQEDRRVCLNCIHWRGDKKKMRALIEQFRPGVAMDLLDGFPESGTCAQDYQSIAIDVRGDAAVTLMFDANFGCVWFSDEEIP